jgi:hypothetical protein
MAQVVDSAQWTGVSTDPFAALSAEDRQGFLRFEGSYKLQLKALAIVAPLALAGAIAFLSVFTGLRLPARAAQDAPLIAGSVIGFVCASLALCVGQWFWRRHARRDQVAPLTIDSHGFVAGKSGRKVKFSDIRSIGFRKRKPLGERVAELIYYAPFYHFRPSREAPILEIVTNDKSRAVLIDLDLLDGNQEKIALILKYRARKQTGISHV